ncbi:alpha/beta hydrolase [Roseiterribacter gracilis]|uniref:Alpha/beta hydrolase n=1 Tax=Roseiterribacter gracilis TaxID=2812848 RepID=A0A8S8XH09_9PROT|nr:alpha/beta hydrolase [Rhodospirillales bacterium TMPK1]
MMTIRAFPLLGLLLLLLVVPAAAQERIEHRIQGAAGTLALHEIKPSRNTSGLSVLLIHGGGPAGVVSFDLPATRPGFAERLAVAGHRVYMLDLRGWGDSDRPAALNAPANANPPLVTVDDAVADIHIAAAWIRGRDRVSAIAVIGWASGGHWAGAFAARHSQFVSHLVLLNSLYGGEGPWALASSVAPPFPAYRTADAAQLTGRWLSTMPDSDKAARKFAIDAYAHDTIASDPTSSTRSPPSVRIPLGYLEDAYRMSRNERVFDVSKVAGHVMFARGEDDFWSRPIDALNFSREAAWANSVRVLEIPGGTHFLLNDHPDRGLDLFTTEVLKLLQR